MKLYARKQNQPHQQASSDFISLSAQPPAASQPVDSILDLQRTLGNQAVQRSLRHQTDPEDQIMDVLGTTADTPSSLQGDEARKVVSGKGAGEPLLPDARAEMETRFGYDLSRVRIHTNNQTAAALGAKAFTSGLDISFRPGRSPSDRQLLTHEIAHVVQQATGESAHLHGAGGDSSRRQALEAQADSRGQQTASAKDTSFQSLKPLPEASSAVVQFAFEDDVLRELHTMPSTEEEGISDDERRTRVANLAARVQRLHVLFNTLFGDDAKRIHERLKQRKRGDALSERFHDMLSTPTRTALLGILESRMRGDDVPVGTGPSLGDIRRDNQRIKINGLPSNQPNYADRAFQGLLSAPLGNDYILCPQYNNGQCSNGISIPKNEFHIDNDPLAKGMPAIITSVFPSKAVAEAVLADMRAQTPPDMPLVTYYMRDGVIFPTTLSATTLPNLLPYLRKKRDDDKADLVALADLAEQLAWWYAGIRFAPGIKSGGGGGGGGGAKVPPTTVGGGGTVAKAAFNAAETAEQLYASTQTVAGNVKRMLAAARQLSAMGGLTATQKAEVIMEFFKKIGFTVRYVKGMAWVDEGAHLLMVADDGRSAFRFIKSTGEILLGKINMTTGQYIWGAIP